MPGRNEVDARKKFGKTFVGRDGGMKKRREMENEAEHEEAKREGKEEPTQERKHQRSEFLHVVQDRAHASRVKKGRKEGK